MGTHKDEKRFFIMCEHRPERRTCRYCKYNHDPNFFDYGCAYPEPVGENVRIDMKKYKHWKRTTGKCSIFKAISIDWTPITTED